MAVSDRLAATQSMVTSMTILSRVLNLAAEIQQIPAPTYEEARRAEFMRVRFAAEGLEAETDALGNVYARFPGADREARPIVVSAHLDTVFPAETPLTLRRERDRMLGPGIGDNSVALASLLGLVWRLAEQGDRPRGDLWLVANVGEEGLGNLRGMYGVLERFGDLPRAYIVLEGIGLGWVYHRGLGVRRYRIEVETAGGHSWGHRGSPSAVHEIARIITALTEIPLSTKPAVSLNVGVAEGGVSVNTIAPSANALVDLRSEDAAALEELARMVERVCSAARRPGVAVRCKIIGARPAGEIPPEHPLVQAAQAALRGAGVKPHLGIASTDANAPLARGLPAVCLGLTEGGNAHTTHEFILTRPLEKGLRSLTALVLAVAS